MHADLGDRLVRGLVRGGVWPRACGLEEPMICRGFAVKPAIHERATSHPGAGLRRQAGG